MLPKVPEICSKGRLHNWKLDRRKPHWPKNQLVPRLEEEAGVHLRPNWLPPSPVFVACTSIYQRGEAVGCIRGLPKHCTVVGNNCVRGNGCPKSSTVGSQPHIAQTFRHRSSSSEDKLIFLLFLPCIDWTWYFGSHFSLKWNLPHLIEALHLWRDGFLGHPPKHTHIGIILRLELNVLTLDWYQVEKICTADDTVGTDGTVRTAALQSLICAFGSPLPVFALFFFFFPSPSLATHLRWRRPSASSFCSAATWWWISL